MILLFFFQAEDGIRDIGVTGVQTCALPIFSAPTLYLKENRFLRNIGGIVLIAAALIFAFIGLSSYWVHLADFSTWQPLPKRSEERRVGKECRSRWSPYH